MPVSSTSSGTVTPIGASSDGDIHPTPAGQDDDVGVDRPSVVELDAA